MSKDIKVGDWVRVNRQSSRSVGEEFKVTEVVKASWSSANGKRYARGDFVDGGIWFRFLDKITSKTAIDFLEMPVGTKFKVRVLDTNYTDPGIYVRTDDGYKPESEYSREHWTGTECDSDFWTNRYEIIPVVAEPVVDAGVAIKATLDFVADARNTLLTPVFAYRKELIALLDSSGPDARPIVQAKLSAVNEVLKRVNF